jgi:hypothetical protein
MKLIFFWGCFLVAVQSFAQLDNGTIAPLFEVTTTQGNTFQLENKLTEGRFVVLHFFACWDYDSWQYAQSGALNALDSSYGTQGTNELSILQIEIDSSNTTAQLGGPEFLSGNNTTQTYGNWNSILQTDVTESFPVAELYHISYAPAIVVICPDRRIRNFNIMPADQLYQAIRDNACPLPSIFANPAIQLINVQRECGNALVDITWSLQNQGLDTLYNVHFLTQGLADTFSLHWSGMLPPFTSDTLTSSNWELASALPFSIHAEMPDSLADAQDTLTINSGLGISSMTVQLELALDNYPQEISWEILNDNDSVIFSGGDFNVPYEYINTNLLMPEPGCYTFKLHDTAGDGLHGSQWSGYDGSCNLRSIDTLTGAPNAVLLNYDGSYNLSSTLNSPASLTVFFEAGSSLKTTEQADIQSFNIFPNPTKSGSDITIQSNFEENFDCTLYTTDGRALSRYTGHRKSCTIPCNPLPSGMYLLVIQSTHNHIYTQRLIVE